MIRRNSDQGMRRLERAVTLGDEQAMVALVNMRLQRGLVRPEHVRDANLLSRPLGTPRPGSRDYDWWPAATQQGNMLGTPYYVFEQDPRTAVLHQVTRGVLGKNVRSWARGRELSDRVWTWMLTRGFLISETGGVDNHAPYEIQYDQNVERDTEAQSQRVVARQAKIFSDYVNHLAMEGEAPSSSPHGPNDGQYMWLVLTEAMRKNRNALSILKWLRVNSTVEYANTLGANVYNYQSRGPGTFGETELALVSTLLGGPPL